jgi:hypothetical protein
MLSKGLSFVPKPKHIDQPDVLRGLCKFRNQVVNVYEANKRAILTAGSSQTATPPTTTLSQDTGTPNSQGPVAMIYCPWEVLKKFTHKTDPTGHPTTNCDLLNTILDNIEKDASTAAESVKHSKSDNITKAERLAIQQLRNNKQIVINKADKGSTVVVVNRDDYIKDGLKHLDNPSVYRKLKTDATHMIYHKISSILSSLKIQRWMPWQFSKFCTPPTDYRTSQLYFLKKIHKNSIGIRPIVSIVSSL